MNEITWIISVKLGHLGGNILKFTYLYVLRSGSSLTGDILSTMPNSTYIFEPLNIIDEKIIYGQSDFVKDYINKLFECDEVWKKLLCIILEFKWWFFFYTIG